MSSSPTPSSAASRTASYRALANSSGLSSAAALHEQLLRHYEALNNLPRGESITSIIFPSGSIETCVLFLGDVHPMIISSLARSMDGHQDNATNSGSEVQIAVDQDRVGEVITGIECRLRLYCAELLERVRGVVFVHNFLETEMLGGKNRARLEESVNQDDLRSIYQDANRLRVTLINNLLESMSEPQRLRFLQSLCPLVMRIKDVGNENRKEQETLLVGLMNGLCTVPSFFVYMGSLSKKDKVVATYLFMSSLVSAGNSAFLQARIERKALGRSLKECLRAVFTFLAGGIFLFVPGLFFSIRWVKVVVTVIITGILFGILIFKRRNENQGWMKDVTTWGICLALVAANAGISDIIHRIP